MTLEQKNAQSTQSLTINEGKTYMTRNGERVTILCKAPSYKVVRGYVWIGVTSDSKKLTFTKYGKFLRNADDDFDLVREA